jgi:pseudouridine synthase
MSLERLQKVLAKSTTYSRRKAERLILEGRVAVNGRTVIRLGTKVDAHRDRISLDGKPLNPEARTVYYLVHKPRGIVCTLNDPQGRPIITDLLKGVKERVFPVGRLDMDSEGLILLTNDGDLALRLQHPRYGVRKTYHVLVKGVPSASRLEKMRQGRDAEQGERPPLKVEPLKVQGRNAWIEIVISEGKKRQVRLMCREAGLEVVRLKRISLGGLTLRGMKPGSFRPLKSQEVSMLKRSTSCT